MAFLLELVCATMRRTCNVESVATPDGDADEHTNQYAHAHAEPDAVQPS